ncbi:hypothetical protein H0H81_012365 [Sphagnurus paluster]|uniref:Glutamyl-tRNA(Gln) amidotransferase subunit A, mitochondrial n=1 Tax=Sphagnurus paluster TaxID=117069 RepID=A0A9P7GNZ9_9AGAR|nr:hypothetical protein H0H81_012365 [Sphagnurus paluster]
MRTAKTWAALQRVRRVSSSAFNAASSTLDSISCRARIVAHNPHVNAFVHVSPPPSASSTTSALAEKSIAIKESICTKDMPTGCASAMLHDFRPPYDATVVRLLREAGADIIGKTNCDEFGMGSMNTHTIHGPVINPFGTSAHYSSSPLTSNAHSNPPERSAGGSSGGSAAAVAAGMCYAALGTDTGGSTRLPASYCGVVGLKPSYGLLSRWGVVSFADSLDCVGVLARRVCDVRTVFDALNVYDPRDPTAALPEIRAMARDTSRRRVNEIDWAGGRLDGLRIGVPQEYFPSEMAAAVIAPVQRVLAALKARGAQVVPVGMPSTLYTLSAYYVLASAEASSCLARFDGVQYGTHVRPPVGTDLSTSGVGKLYAESRSAGFGREVQKRILLGTYALSAGAFDNYFLQAQRVRELVKRDFRKVFMMQDYRQEVDFDVEAGHSDGSGAGVDVLLHPSAIQGPPLVKEKGLGGVAGYVQDVLTVPASLAGVAALSVPMAAGDAGPVGVSVVGQWGAEELVLAVGQVIEESF